MLLFGLEKDGDILIAWKELFEMLTAKSRYRQFVLVIGL